MTRYYTGYSVDDFSNFNNKNNMKNGLLKLTCENLNSAIVYGLLLLCAEIVKVGDVFKLDWRMLVNAFVIGTITSLVKNMLTTSDGSFVGVVPVIPDKK